MKTKDIIQRVSSLYSKGVQSDDSRLTPRHIYNKLVTVRQRLISQRAKKRQKISQFNYQTLNCVELIKALPYECPCLPAVGCKILRTKEKLPKPLTDLSEHLIQSVTSVDGSITYSETTWNAKKYKSGNRFTGNKPDFYIHNGYLYITHSGGPAIVTIVGLFEDVLEAEDYPSICDTDCNDCNDCESPLDKEFSIDGDLIETMIDMAKVELIGEFNQTREDLTNNTIDNIVDESK